MSNNPNQNNPNIPEQPAVPRTKRTILEVLGTDPNTGQDIVIRKTTVGPYAPLQISSRAIESLPADDVKLIVKQHWKMLIFCNPSEKISDSSFGVGIQRYLFSSFADRTTKSYTDPSGAFVEEVYEPPLSTIKSIIFQQARKFLTYLTVNSIDMANYGPNGLQIRIKYTMNVSGLSGIYQTEIGNAEGTYPSEYSELVSESTNWNSSI